MTQWKLTISDETDRAVRGFLARTGLKKGDLSKFVEGAVRAEVLRRTVVQVQEQNVRLGADAAMKLATDAVTWARGLDYKPCGPASAPFNVRKSSRP